MERITLEDIKDYDGDGESQVLDNNILNDYDRVLLSLDKFDIDQLNKVIEYCNEQKLLINISDKRKAAIRNELRVERIKMRKELVKKQPLKKQILKVKFDDDDEDEESESESESKKKIIKRKNLKK